MRCMLSIALAVTVLCAAAASGQGGVRLVGSVSAGFDSFQEKYTIVDRDTLDSVNEFRTRAALGLLAGTYLRDFFLIEGLAQYGRDSREAGGRLKFNKLFWSGKSRVGFEGQVTRRQFGQNSAYSFPNDYDRLFLRAYFKQALGQALAVRITDRVEIQDFERRTEFDYDYRRNKLSVGGEFNWNLMTFLDMRVTHVAMMIPDSTEIEYQAVIPSIEFRRFSGIYDRIVLAAAVERRDYVRGSPRSHFWAVLGSVAAERPVSRHLSLLLEGDLEWYQYDRKNPVYFDYVENRTALLFKFNRSYNLSLGAGPVVGFLKSDISAQDEYTEIGARVRLEYTRGARAWVSLTYEPGTRTYRLFDPAAGSDDVSLFSDYSYQRLSAFANVRIFGPLSLTAFIDFSPEDHKREGDDATATLLSISLTYLF
jgi:hypothetical protein